jgi:carbamate kinase
MNQLIVIALGGNAIKSAKEKGTSEEQFHNVSETTKHLSKLVKAGYRILVTHGNGPQVGNILIQHDSAKDKVPALPMDVCGAQSQGQIGYMISQTFRNHLHQLNIKKPVATIVTQVEVDKTDPAFEHPTKPVGPFYDENGRKKLEEQGFSVVEDSGRGYRRVVPSPKPKKIVEIDAVKQLLEKNLIVIASGGGGIPVINQKGLLSGVEAVIDKDLAGELLAESVKADKLIILTDVEKVAINFNKPNQKNLGEITVSEAEEYMNEGHFAAGSMGPKVMACIKFVKKTGKEALITSPFKVLEALEGKTGTLISK